MQFRLLTHSRQRTPAASATGPKARQPFSPAARGHAKVLDFGLAKKLIAHTDRKSNSETVTLPEEMITGPGVAIGTVAYMSPVQARGEELDARSDLFSLGIVLYEMVSGTPPFAGRTSAVIFEAILNRAPEPPSRWNPRVTPELEQPILQLLAKNRALRYQSAADLYVD